MRVTIHLSSFYEWVDVPDDVKVTPEDIQAGIVRPMINNKPGDPPKYQMQITIKAETHNGTTIKESDIFEKIVQAYQPQGGSRHLSRREAVAELLGANVLPIQAHPSHITLVEVEDDHDDEAIHGEHAEALRARLTFLSTVTSARTRLPIIAPADIDELVEKYVEPAKSHDHAEHLHKHFRVQVKPKPAPAAATKESAS